MITANLNRLELNEFQAENAPDQYCRANFPMLGALGTKSTGMVYFELDPGNNLGRHTDSEEEILLVLDGNVEVQVGNEIGRLGAGEVALVPRMVPHDLRNLGPHTARIVGFFGAPNIVATFDHPWQQLQSNVVSTEAMSQPAAAR